MENTESRLRSRERALDTSKSARFKPVLSRNGAFEDLGSSFGRTSPKASGKSNRSRKSPMTTTTEPCSLSSSSEDDLDCFSQQSKVDDTVVVKQPGEGTDYDPEILLGKELNIRRLPKISKIKVQDDKPRKSSQPPPSSPMKTRGKVKMPPYNVDTSQCHNRTRADIKELRESTLDSTTAMTRPKPRPRPCPQPLPPTPQFEGLPPPNEDDLILSADATRTTKLIRTPSEFPSLSPISKSTSRDPSRISPPLSTSLNLSSKGDTGEPSSLRNRTYKPIRPSSKHVSPRSQASPSFPALDSLGAERSNVPVAKSFPTISPLSNSLKNRVGEEFPLSPLSGQARKKPRTRLVGGGSRLAPFPMSTQELNRVSLSSTNECRGDKHYAREQRKQLLVEASGMEGKMDLYEEDDSLFMAPGIDPTSLCPYCDSPLPTSPTPFFQELLKVTLVKSTPDPRSTNPLGRKAPLSTFVTVCQRHEFESEVLPEAETKGWPKTINWEALSGRIAQMRSDLEEIIKDSGEADLPSLMKKLEEGGGKGPTANNVGKGPRIRCVFWREAMESVLQRGVRAMADVRGQFLDFEKSQPGYYGELGSMIIQQTLLNMFPLDSFDSELVVPFTKNEFIQRILVPEVALRLIMEDRGLKGPAGTEAAILVLRDSTAYGVAMFPEDTGENVGAAGGGEKKGAKTNTIGVGDRIVMERARKRRKELQNDKELKALFEGGSDSKIEGLGGEGQVSVPVAYEDDNSGTTKGIHVQGPNLDHEKSGSRKSSKKKRNATQGDDDDVLSINSKSDGNDSELSLRNDRPLVRTRSQRSNRSTRHTDVSSDSSGAESWFTHSKRLQSKLRNESSIQAQPPFLSPSASDFQRPESPLVSEWKRDIRPFQGEMSSGPSTDLSDMEICSTDDDDSESRARKAGPKEKHRPSHSKKGEYVPAKVLDLESHTPTPKRHAREANEWDHDPTPRARWKNPGSAASTQPKLQKQSVLALARARVQPDSDGTSRGQPLRTKSKKSKAKVSKSDPWKYNYRSDMPESTRSDGNSDSDSRSGEKAKRGSDASNFDWLLDDPER